MVLVGMKVKRTRGRGAHKRDGYTARPAADQQATGRSQYQTQASHVDPLSLSRRQGGKEPGAWDRCGYCTVELERWLREAVSKCPSVSFFGFGHIALDFPDLPWHWSGSRDMKEEP